MFRKIDIVQNLKIDILELKKELAASRDDNQLLKVKIRKLQNEVSKRDRQIETLLDPRKSAFVRNVISEKGASMLINLQERTLKLEKTLVEKDSLIKRLQNDLQTKKLYTVKTGDKKKHFSRQTDSKCNINVPYYERYHESDSEKEEDTKYLEHGLKSLSMCDISQGIERLCFRSAASHSARGTSFQRALSADRTHYEKHHSNVQQIKRTNNDVKAQYEGLSRDHLLSIIESLKNNQHRLSPCIRKGGSPESDLERNELLCDTPHLEIQQLQNYFMDMFSEVDELKTTITELKSKQDTTTNLLKQKDNNIEQLAKQIKSLKRPKSEARSTLQLKRSPSARLCMYKKRATTSGNNSEKKSHGDTKTMAEIQKEAKEEEEIGVCTYPEAEELEPQQKENGVQIIQTRTISIQKFDDPSNYTSHQTIKENKNQSGSKLQTLIAEEETRREKFNNLMEEMLHQAGIKRSNEDSDLDTEVV